ncbi:MAG: DMT family transporter [candidate division WOR-3 bacterium]|nr:DMT family transporter [candidate division WOR-3 bacterium]MCX7756998.1 DMT family transporter [candidate division WOR-3 bacterium]MDW7987835.1 DMT family transporter [candidate division WOR-3 bacterium]
MNISHQLLGESLALISAILWAGAIILFRKSTLTVHPIALNLFKNVFAILMILLTILVRGEKLFIDLPFNYYLSFILSGVLGMAIADTLLFTSLNQIGASLHAIVACSYSPIVILLSVICLKEQLSILEIFGIVLITLAILLTANPKFQPNIKPSQLIVGVILGILANLFTGLGIILIKPKLNSVPLMWATEVRLISGTVILFLFVLLFPNRSRIFLSIFNPQGILYRISGSLLGTYLALVCWLGAMKFSKASLAAVLSQSSSIFIFLFAYFFLKEKLSRIKIVALAVAAMGVFLVFTKSF